MAGGVLYKVMPLSLGCSVKSHLPHPAKAGPGHEAEGFIGSCPCSISLHNVACHGTLHSAWLCGVVVFCVQDKRVNENMFCKHGPLCSLEGLKAEQSCLRSLFYSTGFVVPPDELGYKKGMRLSVEVCLH